VDEGLAVGVGGGGDPESDAAVVDGVVGVGDGLALEQDHGAEIVAAVTGVCCHADAAVRGCGLSWARVGSVQPPM
jgi:hypothetical protein